MMRELMTKTLFALSILLSAQAFAFDVDGLSYAVFSGTTNVEVTRHHRNIDLDIVIPATVADGTTTYSVTSIKGSAFYGRGITSVIIPNSVTSIGDSAFLNNALTSVIIPDSATTIGDSAFQRNVLTSVIIPDSVTTIGDYAFSFNALTSVTIGNSVTTIGSFAFSETHAPQPQGPRGALTSVTIPDSVTSIGRSAFYRNALTSAAFEGDFGTFNLDMFGQNFNLAVITYCEGTTGWPQGFKLGSTTGRAGRGRAITTAPVNCSTVSPKPRPSTR